jgi:hypothetical protein
MPLVYDFLYRLTHETAFIPHYLKKIVIAPKRSISEVAHCHRAYRQEHGVNFVNILFCVRSAAGYTKVAYSHVTYCYTNALCS